MDTNGFFVLTKPMGIYGTLVGNLMTLLKAIYRSNELVVKWSFSVKSKRTMTYLFS